MISYWSGINLGIDINKEKGRYSYSWRRHGSKLYITNNLNSLSSRFWVENAKFEPTADPEKSKIEKFLFSLCFVYSDKTKNLENGKSPS